MLILLFVGFLTFYGFYLWMVAKKYSHLPCHLGSEFPIIGNLYYSFKSFFISHDDLLALLERLLPENKGICVIWIYFVPVVAISDPPLIEKLSKDPAFADKEPLVYESTLNLMRGTFTYAFSDTKWKQRRKILNHSMKEQSLMTYHNTFVKTSKKVVDKMEQETGVFNVGRYMKMISLESILETHLGSELNVLDNQELYKLIEWGVKQTSKSLVNPVYGFFMKIYQVVTSDSKPLVQIIEECLQNQNGKQGKVIEGKSENLYINAVLQQYSSTDSNFTEAKQELMELILVGLQAMGTVASAALVFMAALPDIQKKVWEEQENIFGDSERDPTIMDVKRMDYLERLLKEILRFFSAPYVSRRTRAKIVIDDKLIPNHSTVLIGARLMRMNNNYWENPSNCDPDRYLRNEPPKDYKQSFSNFGYGIRNCPGSQYALIQGMILISTIIRRFKVVQNRKFEDIKLSAQIMMDIKGGYNISIEKRKKLID